MSQHRTVYIQSIQPDRNEQAVYRSYPMYFSQRDKSKHSTLYTLSIQPDWHEQTVYCIFQSIQPDRNE